MHESSCSDCPNNRNNRSTRKTLVEDDFSRITGKEYKIRGFFGLWPFAVNYKVVRCDFSAGKKENFVSLLF